MATKNKGNPVVREGRCVVFSDGVIRADLSRIGPSPDEKAKGEKFIRGAALAMEQAVSTLDQAALGDLIQDILQAERIACFGLLKAEAAATNLQSDLTMLGKKP